MKRIVVWLVLGALLLGGVLTSCGTNDPIYHIFVDVEECLNFELNKHEDARITQYETPATDKALEDLQYNKFWAGKYISSELTFEIFAYEFVSKDEAKVYFENETGTLEKRDTFWRLSGGAFSSRLIVVDEKNAYIVHTSTAQVKAVREFLKKNFTKELDFSTL